MTLNERATFDVAVRLREGGAPIADIFSFISGLYFRGKVAYARTFAAPPAGAAGAHVIAAGRGFIPLDTLLTMEDLQQIARVPIDLDEPRYREPLERHARELAQTAGEICEVVLLGSVATPKYIAPLLEVFGERLLFPADFVGRGDMSRGGLMLRCVESRRELVYTPVLGAMRHGKRPPKLGPK